MKPATRIVSSICPASGFPRYHAPEWALDTADGHYRFEVTIVGTNTLLVVPIGTPSVADTEASFHRHRDVVRNHISGSGTGYNLLVDLGRTHSAPLASRQRYAQLLLDEIDVVERCIFFGADRVLSTLVRIGRSLSPKFSNVHMVTDYASAISLVLAGADPNASPELQPAAGNHIAAITRYLGRMTWHGDLQQEIPELVDAHPFAELYRVVAATQEDWRALTEEQTRQEQERRRHLEEISVLASFAMENPHPVLRCDAAGNILYTNRAAAGLQLGEEGQEGRVDARVVRLVRAALEEDAAKDVELRLGDATFTFRFVPFVAAGYVNLYGHNITDRLQTEDALRDAERQLKHIADRTPIIMLAANAGGTITVAEGRGLSRLGFAPGELVGRAIDSAFPETPAAQHLLETALRGEACGEQVQMGNLILDFWVEPVEEADGSVSGAVALGNDVTALKRAEQVAREAQGVAEAAAQAKSEFLANMSHEIRTPLNAIIGLTRLLMDSELNAEQLDFLRTVRASGDSLLTIINDILDFSKIDAGHLELEKQPFHLRQVLEEALDLMAPKAGEKGLELAYTIDPGVPAYLESDVTRLRQILVNLLGNAIKFTAAGEVVVSVKSTQRDNALHEVQFDVRDTGIGIPAERMDRLFRSFSQVDASTTRRYGGTGLGLAISKRLAELMGGSIWADSTPGSGSTFHLTVVAPAGSGPAPAERLHAVQADLKGRRVLIVDDNDTNRLILRRLLKGWGMAVAEADSGAAALDYLQARPPVEVVILDMHMPEMDGAMLAQRIRRDGLADGAPLVMLTSLGDPTPAVRSVSFAAFLSKPLKPEQMLLALRGALQNNVTAQRQVLRPSGAASRRIAPIAAAHPLTILLAEDNVVNQKVAVRMLQRLGYEPDVAADGSEVLAALERQPYDVVLMDVQMPVMDGVEATAELIARWPEARPHIIAMTANALKGDRERYMAAGMDGYISKPVRLEELARVLSQVAPLEPGNP
jgi:signal transduction histidine kinase/DNA-binding response OmpR family regulator